MTDTEMVKLEDLERIVHAAANWLAMAEKQVTEAQRNCDEAYRNLADRREELALYRQKLSALKNS